MFHHPIPTARRPEATRAPGATACARLRLHRAVAGLALAILLGACGGDGSGATSELRLCGEDAARDVPRFTLIREWAVGGAEDRKLRLSHVSWTAASPGGGLSFGQRAVAPIVTLNADGTVRSEIGRAGSGPGEWSSLGGVHIAWYGDTLVATESMARRVHRFLESGELLETRVLTTSNETPGQISRVLRNGSVVAYTPSLTNYATLSRWSEAEARWDSITRRGRFSYRLQRGGGRFSVGSMPIVDDPLWTASPDGRSVVVVDRNASSTPDSAEFRIRRVSDDGTVLLDRTVCYRPRRFPPEEQEDTIQAQLQPLIDGNRLSRPIPAVESDIRESIFLPEFFPPVTLMVVGTEGDIWLRREILDDGFAFWEIRDAEGELTGMLRLPAERRIRAVDGDVVWTVEHDGWDVPVISRTRLVRR